MPLWRGTPARRDCLRGRPEFQFDHVTAKPLSRETWLTYATAYRDHSAGHQWILVTAMPEAFYLAGLRKANSRSAMVLALALVLSLVLGAALASMVTAPLRHMAHATRTMARRGPERPGARQPDWRSSMLSRDRSTPWRPGSRRRLTIWSEKSRRGRAASAS